MLQLTVGKDNKSVPIYSTPITDTGFSVLLTPGVAVAVSVPEGAKTALISGSDHYFVALLTATLPVPGAFAIQNAGLNQQAVEWPEGAGSGVTLSFISRNGMDVVVSFWG